MPKPLPEINPLDIDVGRYPMKAETVKKIRLATLRTQNAMARFLGIQPVTMARWEKEDGLISNPAQIAMLALLYMAQEDAEELRLFIAWIVKFRPDLREAKPGTVFEPPLYGHRNPFADFPKD